MKLVLTSYIAAKWFEGHSNFVSEWTNLSNIGLRNFFAIIFVHSEIHTLVVDEESLSKLFNW